MTAGSGEQAERDVVGSLLNLAIALMVATVYHLFAAIIYSIGIGILIGAGLVVLWSLGWSVPAAIPYQGLLIGVVSGMFVAVASTASAD